MRGLGRGPPGRSPPSPAGRCLDPPPPGVMPNGLFPPGLGPGRGPPGLGAPSVREAGAGPGLGADGWAARFAASSCCRLSSSSARFCSAATSMSRALAGLGSSTFGAGGAGCRDAGPGLGAGALGAAARFFAGAFFAALTSVLAWAILAGLGAAGRGFGAAFAVSFAGSACLAAGAAGAPFPSAYCWRSRRATGASTVLDADFTNSPMSLSLASTSLLVVPSSFASSCTRGLPATALLTSRSHGQRPPTSSLH